LFDAAAVATRNVSVMVVAVVLLLRGWVSVFLDSWNRLPQEFLHRKLDPLFETDLFGPDTRDGADRGKDRRQRGSGGVDAAIVIARYYCSYGFCVVWRQKWRF